MKIAITGASGFIGSGLVAFLEQRGHEIFPLLRIQSGLRNAIYWNPTTGQIDSKGLEGLHAVIHLAGENLAGRWTEAKKARILASRTEGTRLLSQAIAGLRQPPLTCISASAVGYYGDAGETILTESAAPGKGFLAEVCREWEAATEPAKRAGIRVVNCRFGIILDSRGGALASLLPLFRAGLGGRLGHGKQHWSWISLHDVQRALEFILHHDGLNDAVNITAPNPVNNAEFTRVLAKALHRPAFFTVPSWVLRLAMGEMAQEMLLSSSHVMPEKLLSAGFQFEHPDLGGALAAII